MQFNERSEQPFVDLVMELTNNGVRTVLCSQLFDAAVKKHMNIEEAYSTFKTLVSDGYIKPEYNWPYPYYIEINTVDKFLIDHNFRALYFLQPSEKDEFFNYYHEYQIRVNQSLKNAFSRGYKTEAEFIVEQQKKGQNTLDAIAHNTEKGTSSLEAIEAQSQDMNDLLQRILNLEEYIRQDTDRTADASEGINDGTTKIKALQQRIHDSVSEVLLESEVQTSILTSVDKKYKPKRTKIRSWISICIALGSFILALLSFCRSCNSSIEQNKHYQNDQANTANVCPSPNDSVCNNPTIPFEDVS